LPNKLFAIRKASEIKSFSPKTKIKELKKALKRHSSVEKIEVKLPEVSGSIP
jgi:hypothetical protein